jgi:hypothetical protein
MDSCIEGKGHYRGDIFPYSNTPLRAVAHACFDNQNLDGPAVEHGIDLVVDKVAVLDDAGGWAIDRILSAHPPHPHDRSTVLLALHCIRVDGPHWSGIRR